jgi:hypothetical protein
MLNKRIPVSEETHKRLKRFCVDYDSTFEDGINFLLNFIEKEKKSEKPT